MSERPPPSSPAAEGLSRFFFGPGLPLFLLAATAAYEAFLLLVLFSPAAFGAWGDFTTQFKQWCFRYDPRTGGMDWDTVGVMVSEPLFIALIAVSVWWRNLAEVRLSRLWRGHRRPLLGGLFAATVAIAGLYLTGQSAPDPDLPFPGERIRTHLAIPELIFIDQREQPFRFAELEGRVVLATGVTALCSTACPEILRTTRDIRDRLPEETRASLDVVLLSLDPDYETTGLMDAMAAAYDLPYPAYRFVTSDPESQRAVLTDLGFAPVRNPETGVIEHTNLFLLIDREGRIAYRFTLDSRLDTWLPEAIESLVSEAGGA